MSEHAKERKRRVVQSAAAAAAAKLVTVATGLISVPLTLNYLGPERYGMWMTMSSLVAMLAFADFGMGNGVLALVAKAHGEDDRHRIRAGVSSAFAALTVVAATILLGLLLVYPVISWARLFNVTSPQAQAEAGPAFAVFVGAFALAIPLSIVQRVQMGLQRGFIASLWQCLGSVLALIGVLMGVQLHASLPWLVAALTGFPLLASMLNSASFFVRSRRDIAPSPRHVSRALLRAIAKTGLLYFTLQLVAAVTYTSDSLVITQMLGAAAVAPFAVTERMFALISMFVGLALTPLWPAYAEALARGDVAWVRSTLLRSLVLSVCCAAVMACVLVTFGKAIVLAWAGGSVQPTSLLLASFGVWKLIECVGMALAMFLNGANIVRFQITVALTTAVVAIAGKILLTPVIGLPGVLWASTAAYTLFCLIPILWMLPRLLPKNPVAISP